MSMEREAEVLGMPSQQEAAVLQAKRLAQGRTAITQYVKRLENSARLLEDEPEVSELFCALAELREGMIEHDPEAAQKLYEKALEAFDMSRGANTGLRRVKRAEGDDEATIASIEREIPGADPVRKAQLRRELVRTNLYCAKDPEMAIAQLELIAEEEEDDEEERPFDEELFYLWEDALLATSAWERYEKLLRDALSEQTEIGDMTHYLLTRLWILYRCILPDEDQADVLWETLSAHDYLDDELVDYGITRAERLDSREDLVNILQQALDREDFESPYEPFYRLLLVDIAHYECGDTDLALKILHDGIAKYPQNLALLHKNLCICLELGDCSKLLEALSPLSLALQSPQLKAEKLCEIARIFRDELDSASDARDVYVEANRTCPSYEPAIEALSEFYIEDGNWPKLAEMLEEELNYATIHNDANYTTEVYTEKHARLAWIYEARLNLCFKAFSHYQAILHYRPDDLAALKGAARMTHTIGNWADLLKLYAAAEGVTLDPTEHVFLLEQIAEITEKHLKDLKLACMSLEAIRQIDAHRQNTNASLARLYIQLEMWEKLINLNDEECTYSKNSEYKASLLYNNGELSEIKLQLIPQAIQYYEKARAAWPQSRQAYAALGRLYRKQHDHEKLVELWRAYAELCQDPVQKCSTLHKIAHLLEGPLDSVEDAVEVYENCIKVNPADALARKFLLETYQKAGKWQDVLRILNLELEAGGTFSQPWLTHFWKARIHRYRLAENDIALEEYGKALDGNIEDTALMRLWVDFALKLDKLDEAIQKLESMCDIVKTTDAKREIMRVLADLRMRRDHDPQKIADLIFEPPAVDSDEEGSAETIVVTADDASRLSELSKTMIHACRMDWIPRLRMDFEEPSPKSIHHHALNASVIMNIPDEIRPETLDVLNNIENSETALSLYAKLSPAKRPNFMQIRQDILALPSLEAQEMRRWCVISRLLNGDLSDPTDQLLPDAKDDELSYRPDLELLAAYYYEIAEARESKWQKLLAVYEIQEASSRNEEEHISIVLQRAYILKAKLRRYQEALDCLREACQRCSIDNPKREMLYDQLYKEGDWDFLVDQVRKHLSQASDDNVKCSALWRRLANIFTAGKTNLNEALVCLDQSYHAAPGDGSILVEISRIAAKINEYEIARRALDDYIERHDPPLEAQLALEPELLELHFYQPGGDPGRMLAYFDALSRNTAQSRDTQIILAKAHARAGDPQVAASILLNIVDASILEEDLPLWIILADLYIDRLDDASTGEKLLWKLFSVYPEADGVFERINALYTRNAERLMLVENLKRTVDESSVISSQPLLVCKYLSFAAKILSKELRRWDEAEILYSRAINASERAKGNVNGDSVNDLVKDYALVRCNVPGQSKNAYDAFCDILVRDPFQVEIYRAALEICRRNDCHDRIRILSQMAKVFVPGADLPLAPANVRPPRINPNRKFNEQKLAECLLPPDLREVRDVLHEAMPLLVRRFKDLVPKPSLLGSKSLKHQEFNDFIAFTSNTLALSGAHGYVSNEPDRVPKVYDSDFWFSLETLDEMPSEAQRHWAGYIGGLIWSNINQILSFQPEQVWYTLDGIYYVARGKSLAERNAYTLEAADQVKFGLSRSRHQAVAQLIDEKDGLRERMTLESASGWNNALYAAADRAALLFSGSLETSIPALLAADGWSPSKASPEYLAGLYKQLRRIPELIKFALSDDYLNLRETAGFGVPSHFTT